MITTQSRFEVLGINDDKDFCQCCGKTGLQSVVWIENLETGEIKHFGSTCALKPSKEFNLQKMDLVIAKSKWNAITFRRWKMTSKAYHAAGGQSQYNRQTGESIPLDRPLWDKFAALAKEYTSP